jgi:hypothetical protein
MGSWEKRLVQVLTVITALASFAGAQNPQTLPSDFGTTQRSARLAASAGFIDILGIKLGMPAETALSILKTNNPTARITFQRTSDYESAWIQDLPRTDPSHQFVNEIDLEPARMPGDRIRIGLSIPPSKQVVHSIERTSALPTPVAIVNIVDGLRKKYGPETAGPDFKWATMSPFDGTTKTLVWIFDTEGRRVSIETVGGKNMSTCASTGANGMGAPDIKIRQFKSDDRTYSRESIINSACYPYVILTAVINADGYQPGLNGTARYFTLSTFDWPLVINGANAFYAFVDQSGQRAAAQAQQQAQQRGKDIKY